MYVSTNPGLLGHKNKSKFSDDGSITGLNYNGALKKIKLTSYTITACCTRE